MGFEFWPAVVAGFAGGVAMSLMITMMRVAGKTEMDMALIQGTMFTGNRGRAKLIGLFTHLVMMSALVFGSIYAALFAWFGTSPGSAWWTGALIGVVHGVVAGIAMGMVAAVHPRMRHGAGESVMKPPGLFAKNYGAMTPPGMVMAHVVYGLVVGAVYGFLAG